MKVVKFILFKKSIICNNVYILAPSRHATIINCSQWRNASSDPHMIVTWQVRKVLRSYPTYITLEMLRGFGLKGDLTETGNRPGIYRPFYRYGGPIKFIRFKEYYKMLRGHSLSIYARFPGKKGTLIYISGKKAIIITSKHGATIFFCHYNLFFRKT